MLNISRLEKFAGQCKFLLGNLTPRMINKNKKLVPYMTAMWPRLFFPFQDNDQNMCVRDPALRQKELSANTNQNT